MTVMAQAAPLRAALPAELRGLRRDEARLCVVDRGAQTVMHTTVAQISAHLAAGDVLVVNSSRTLPGAIVVSRDDGSAVQLRPAVRNGRNWAALVVGARPPHANVPLMVGERLHGPDGLQFAVRATRSDTPLLWSLDVEAGDPFSALLRHGQPIRYSYVPEAVALEHYENVYASHPGSIEPPSAGRHLTWELLTSLRRRGVRIVDIVLHCTISSLQDDDADARKPLLEEWFSVDERCADAVAGARRVVAVGTTVVRALESAADPSALVRPSVGWTRLAINPRRPPRVVDALLTGLHEPPASHLEMLHAFTGRALLDRAYAEARELGYLWHEFGDAMLIL